MLWSPCSSPTSVTLTRISTDEVNQPYSLEAQTKGLEQFGASQPGMMITHRFADQASGATLERPGLQRALDLARQGAHDVLLVYRIDRLSRLIVGLMTVVKELEEVEQAAVVEAIFAKYVTKRLGTTLIAGCLNETGRRTNYGNLWTAKGVLTLLRNPCLRRQDPPRPRHPRRQAQRNHQTGNVRARSAPPR